MNRYANTEKYGYRVVPVPTDYCPFGYTIDYRGVHSDPLYSLWYDTAVPDGTMIQLTGIRLLDQVHSQFNNCRN